MLSPLLKPQAINGGLLSSSKLSHAIYGTGDALDKNNPSAFATMVQVIDAAQDVAETIANTIGLRSPYFVIGEIPQDTSPQYIWSSFDKPANGVIRAVSNAINRWNIKQQGVIIDCLGDVNATMSVEYTTKPLVYLSNSVLDSRIRKPTIVKATIAISNYLADDASGMGLNQVAAWDPTGASEYGRDKLLYGGNTRAQYALYKLRWLMENGQPFTVYTPHGYYENMLISSISPRTNERSLDMLLCDITYQEAIMSAPYSTRDELAARTATRYSVDPNTTRSISNWLR